MFGARSRPAMHQRQVVRGSQARVTHLILCVGRSREKGPLMDRGGYSGDRWRAGFSCARSFPGGNWCGPALLVKAGEACLFIRRRSVLECGALGIGETCQDGLNEGFPRLWESGAIYGCCGFSVFRESGLAGGSSAFYSGRGEIVKWICSLLLCNWSFLIEKSMFDGSNFVELLFNVMSEIVLIMFFWNWKIIYEILTENFLFRVILARKLKNRKDRLKNFRNEWLIWKIKYLLIDNPAYDNKLKKPIPWSK